MKSIELVNIQLVEKLNNTLILYFGIPRREKNLPDPVDMLIATILSQNTNDRNSYKAYLDLKKSFPKWEDAASLKAAELEDIIRVAGLANQKAKTIKNFLSTLIKKKGSISLKYFEKLNESEALGELIKYKGIGVKTASCVLLFSMNRNVCPVDTHVHRTLNRIGIVKTSTPDKTFFILNKNLPKGIAHSLHTNLIRLGREICRPKKPACRVCPVIEICRFINKNFDKQKSYAEKSFMLLDNINTK